MEFIMSLAKIAIVAYGGLCLLLVLFQGKYVYYPDTDIGADPSKAGMDFENLMLETRDGENVSAWFVPAGPGPGDRYALLFCHGNAGNISHRLDSIATFHELGLDVLIFDYRGYGKSSGKPSEKGTYADTRAAWDYLVDSRKVLPERIIVFGRSLGGGVATQLASAVTPGALVLESAFTSAQAMAHQMFPFLPTRLLCRYKYDNMGLITGMQCPIVIAHGQQDQTIPFSHGQRLFEKAPAPKHFMEFKGGHNDGGMDTDTTYREAFKQFLAALKHDSTMKE